MRLPTTHSYERADMTYRYYANDSVVVSCSLCIGHQVVEQDDCMDAFAIYVQMQIHIMLHYTGPKLQLYSLVSMQWVVSVKQRSL